MRIMQKMWIDNSLTNDNNINYLAKNDTSPQLINPNLSEFIQGNMYIRIIRLIWATRVGWSSLLTRTATTLKMRLFAQHSSETCQTNDTT